MRKILPLLAVLALTGAMVSGCANAERKMGRGIANLMEPLRMGEMRRSMEQTAILEGPDASYSYGFIHGLNKTLARTGIGLYEIVTAPIPPYDPVATAYLTPGPVYPDSYQTSLIAESSFSTETNLW